MFSKTPKGSKFYKIHVSYLGVSNKTANPTHLAKPIGSEPTAIRPDDLAVGDESLPSQTDFGGSSGGSSLPKPNPPNPTVIYNLALNKSQFIVQFSEFNRSFSLFHSFYLSMANSLHGSLEL